MPELPEVETVVRELRAKIRNKKIKKVKVFLPKIISVGPKTLSNIRKNNPETVKKFILGAVGKTIKGIRRRAKMIIIDFTCPQRQQAGWRCGRESTSALLVHLKMTGQLIYLSKKDLNQPIRLLNSQNIKPVTLPAKWTHVIFEFTDGSKLFYNDMRQFGYLKLVQDNQITKVPEFNEYGPEPLDKKFTLSIFQDILKKRPTAKIKSFLFDPNLIAGIGNIYSDEILYYAKICPTRIIQTLTQTEQTRLFKGIKKVLQDAIKYCGSSVGDFVRPSGKWGTYGKAHKVYGKARKPCQICGSIIKSIKFNGRTASFCPRCQK